jgi:glycine/D-amino acid oxidase-like deaminating enzyme
MESLVACEIGSRDPKKIVEGTRDVVDLQHLRQLDDSLLEVIERRDRLMIVSGCGGRMFKFAPLLGEHIAAVLAGIAATSRLDHWSKPLIAPV